MQEEIDNGNKKLYLPSYGLKNGVAGLAFAIDGWYGNKIEIESLEICGGSYSGTLKFTFYDHFGLDTPDMTEEVIFDAVPGLIPGFRQWYILQHWNGLGATTQPKPFVTIFCYYIINAISNRLWQNN